MNHQQDSSLCLLIHLSFVCLCVRVELLSLVTKWTLNMCLLVRLVTIKYCVCEYNCIWIFANLITLCVGVCVLIKYFSVSENLTYEYKKQNLRYFMKKALNYKLN